MTTTTALRIYLVSRDNYVAYDENAGFVIAAPDADTARRIAMSNAADEGQAAWLDAERSIAVNIGVAADDVTEGVILRDFHAG